MENNFRPDFALTPYFRENNLARHLQPDEELLWECHSPTYSRLFWQIVVAELVIIVAVLLIPDPFLKWTLFILLFFIAPFVTFAVYYGCFKNTKHYILTSNRFLVLYYELGMGKKMENIDFTQLIELNLTKKSIKITSPTIPVAKLTPYRDVEWLYYELLLRWQHVRQRAMQIELLEVERVYRPPMRRYWFYLVVRTVILIPIWLLFISPYIFGWPIAITYICLVLLNLYSVMHTKKGSWIKTTSWFQTLTMGKEYRNAKHAPVYVRLDIIAWVFPFLSIVLFWQLFHR